MTQVFSKVDISTGEVLIERVKRGEYGMGKLSPDSEYIAKGYFVFKDTKNSADIFSRYVANGYDVDKVEGTVSKLYTKLDLDLNAIKNSVVTKIDKNTESRILAIASRDRQRNLQAKYTQLLGKKLLATITEAEEDAMTSIESIHSEIEDILTTGNKLCEDVRIATSLATIKEIYADIKE